MIRWDAVRHERYLILLAMVGGFLTLAWGYVLVGLLSPLAGLGVRRTGLWVLGHAALYFGGAIGLARRRSTLAWGALMMAFGGVLLSGLVVESLLKILFGGLGLYLGYRAAVEADYDLPAIESVGN